MTLAENHTKTFVSSNLFALLLVSISEKKKQYLMMENNFFILQKRVVDVVNDFNLHFLGHVELVCPFSYLQFFYTTWLKYVSLYMRVWQEMNVLITVVLIIWAALRAFQRVIDVWIKDDKRKERNLNEFCCKVNEERKAHMNDVGHVMLLHAPLSDAERCESLLSCETCVIWVVEQIRVDAFEIIFVRLAS